jgi:hypothetical protein
MEYEGDQSVVVEALARNRRMAGAECATGVGFINETMEYPK